MRILLLITLSLFLGLSSVSARSLTKTEPTVYEIIMQRIQAHEWANVTKVTSLDAEVALRLSTISANGSWSDIDYTSTAQTNWEPITHLDRLKNMVLAYTLNTSNYVGNTELYARISSAFGYWYATDPRSTNWFMQQIACPQRVGVLLILMRTGTQQLSSTLENNLIARIVSIGGRPDAPGSQGTGANKVDIATHWVYRGCLTQDESVLSFGVEQVYYPVFMTTGEGLQNDYSYFQHGQQFFTGGYGNSFITGIAKVANFTMGTIYEMPSDKLQLVTNFTRDAYLPLIRGKYFLYNSIGRGLSRPSALSAMGSVGVANLVKNIDSANALKYDSAVKRMKGEEPATYGMATQQIHYWRGDYSLYYSPAYHFDVRMASVRTYRNENGNSENLKGYFLSEGAQTITVDGDEYLDIFPVWDWTKIPGITAPQKSLIPLPAQWGTYGTSTFAGGVSNGSCGITTFSLNNTEYNINTSAKKAWFMFGNEVVCLGASINSTATEEINTTGNQCLLDGDVTIHSNGAETNLTQGTYNYNNNVDWIYHDKVGYFFPSGGNVNIANKPQSGNWYSINTSYSSETVTKNVFKLWLNHGTQPAAAAYAYVVVPAKTLDEVRSYDSGNIEILINSDSLQLVHNKSQNLWGFVFYKAASYTNVGFSIKASGSCALLLKNPENTFVQGWIADPAQNKSKITLRFVSSAITTEKELVSLFPVPPMAGSTLEFSIDQNTANYVESILNTQKIYPTDDSFVRNGSYATTTYGAQALLTVKNDVSGYARQSFVKFDLSGVDPQSITDAKLVLYVKNANTTVTSTTWQIYYVSNDSWTESTLTWNNKPTAGTNAIISHLGSIASSEVELNLTDTVISEATKTSKLLSLQLVSTAVGSTTDASFSSKEASSNTEWPYLLITKKQAGNLMGIESKLMPIQLQAFSSITKKGEDGSLYICCSQPIKIEINIYEMNGRKVSFFSSIINSGFNTLSIPTSSFYAGIYLLSVNDENENSLGVSKLIIQ